jgi:serine/threonine protein kinase, bacterial
VPPSCKPSTVHNFVPEVGAVPFPGYQLLRLRGRGGFATVWESTSPGGPNIAVKFMSSANVSTTAKELRSLQAVQQLDHPRLLKIRQVWSIPGSIAIAMDLADASLLDLFEVYLAEFGRPIDQKKLLRMFYQVAEGLDFLNARKHRIDGRLVGLQHGDIKPNNILLVNDQALLADYGLAMPTSGPMVPCARQGTAEYSAPEVFQGLVSDRSDQFSLAVSYYLLRGCGYPYPAPPGVGETLKNYVRPDPDLSLIPADERPILCRSLSAIPQNRYPTCLDFVKALLRVNDLQAVEQEDGTIRLEHYMPPLGSPQTSKIYKLS